VIKALSIGLGRKARFFLVLAICAATPLAGRTAQQLSVLPGFNVEMIHASQKGEGSWICMTTDPQGRLIIAQQGGVSNLLRLTLSPAGQVEKIEKIALPVGSAMGLLYAFDSLYVNGIGPDGFGLYRLHDNRQTDQYDGVKLIRKLDGEANSEHGGHGIVLGPDGHIYMACGNFTLPPKETAADSPYKNFGEDLVLPRDEDSLGFSVGIKPPEGIILRTDAEGAKWELFAGGLRNVYDIAFNTKGELFGFDSDAECDWGLPWYRPIRIVHLVSGGEYGFREGSGKWPSWYADSLPPAVNVGLGSPTGLKFGTRSQFPDKYKKALFALDWSYGRIFAVHFTPAGASYRATYEVFVKGTPLSLTSLDFGLDGAMYFITGGRGTAAALYRVTYTGPESAQAGPKDSRASERARQLRHKLEAFQGNASLEAVGFLWRYLNSDDRFIRFAARLALESQPPAQWIGRALSEKRPNAALTALLGLARCGGKETQTPLLRALARFPLEKLSEEQQLEKLRVLELSFVRQGKPEPAPAAAAREELDACYPAPYERVNFELSELLIYLEAPEAIGKTLALLDSAPTQEEQVHYIFILRTIQSGWTLEQRKHYFSWFNQDQAGDTPAPTFVTGPKYFPWSHRAGPQPQPSPELVRWFNEAGREYGDGCAFPAYLVNIKKEAAATLTDAERAELAPWLVEKENEEAGPVVQRRFVKQWTMPDAEPALGQLAKGRSLDRGREIFTSDSCIVCHRFGNQGGSVGPDLTTVASRFDSRDILESILLPSKVINEQYQNMNIFLRDGDVLAGRILHEDTHDLVLRSDAMAGTTVEIPKGNVQSRRVSKISPMPDGLVNNLTLEEILDLIAYLQSGGKMPVAASRGK
jgi:putative heme-binding domain-containing protein